MVLVMHKELILSGQPGSNGATSWWWMYAMAMTMETTPALLLATDNHWKLLTNYRLKVSYVQYHGHGMSKFKVYHAEQDVAGFRQKVCMYLMTSICICKLASTKMQDFVFNGTYVQYSAEAMHARQTDRATRQCASFFVTCILLPDTLLHAR